MWLPMQNGVKEVEPNEWVGGLDPSGVMGTSERNDPGTAAEHCQAARAPLREPGTTCDMIAMAEVISRRCDRHESA